MYVLITNTKKTLQKEADDFWKKFQLYRKDKGPLSHDEEEKYKDIPCDCYKGKKPCVGCRYLEDHEEKFTEYIEIEEFNFQISKNVLHELLSDGDFTLYHVNLKEDVLCMALIMSKYSGRVRGKTWLVYVEDHFNEE